MLGRETNEMVDKSQLCSDNEGSHLVAELTHTLPLTLTSTHTHTSSLALITYASEVFNNLNMLFSLASLFLLFQLNILQT